MPQWMWECKYLFHIPRFTSFGKDLDVRWLCSTAATVFSFPKNCRSVFHNCYTKILTNRAHWLLDSSLCLCLFGDCCSSRVKWDPLVVWTYSPDGSWGWALLSTWVGHLYVLFCKVFIKVIYPLLTWLFTMAFVASWVLYQTYSLKTFSPIFFQVACLPCWLFPLHFKSFWVWYDPIGLFLLLLPTL